MFPAMAALAAISALGGVLAGKNGRKEIDPAVLRQMFGPDAINQDTMDMFNNMINSPIGQQAMQSAAEGGQQFQQDLASQLGKAGFGAGGDVNSPLAAFQTAAGGQAVAGMQRGVRANFYNAASQAASQNLNDRMNVWANSRSQAMAQPSFGQSLGGALLGAAGTLAPYVGNGVPKTDIAPNPGVPQPDANSANSTVAPNPGIGWQDNSAVGAIPAGGAGLFGAAGSQFMSKRRRNPYYNPYNSDNQA